MRANSELIRVLAHESRLYLRDGDAPVFISERRAGPRGVCLVEGANINNCGQLSGFRLDDLCPIRYCALYFAFLLSIQIPCRLQVFRPIWHERAVSCVKKADLENRCASGRMDESFFDGVRGGGD